MSGEACTERWKPWRRWKFIGGPQELTLFTQACYGVAEHTAKPDDATKETRGGGETDSCLTNGGKGDFNLAIGGEGQWWSLGLQGLQECRTLWKAVTV
uniref:Uncharacterized protein n=1 Tax=Knipowitschia caucasica TaxID=637954 RepID=A0AAV2J1H9_KNICA